jgi:hypothetical protein
VKEGLLTDWPLTVTTKGPDDAPAGTTATIFVSLQLEIPTFAEFSVTVLVPCTELNSVPVIVTYVPVMPDDGEIPLIPSEGTTVNPTGLLGPPATVTVTSPVDAPTGTETVIAVVLQLVGIAFVPANDTVLAPWVEPKFAPEIVTTEPTTPEVGLKLVMLGLGITVKVTPLLAVPPTVTVTFPVVADGGTVTPIAASFQLVGEPAVPLKATVLLPCVA